MLGAVILLHVLFLSLFFLPNSNLLPTTWRRGEGAKEEIGGVGSVVWYSGKAPG